MIRSVSFLQRRPDLDRDAFRRYYEEKHAPLAQPHLAGLRHYVRNHVRAERGAPPVAFDTISEFEYSDRAAFDAMLAMLEGPIGDRIRADELNFMHKPGNSFFASQRTVFGNAARPRPGDSAKAIALLACPSGDTRDPLVASAGERAHELLTSGGALHVELDLALPGDPLGAPLWDGLLHVWFPADADPGRQLADFSEFASREIAAARVHCLWIDERGEPNRLAAEENPA